MMHTAAAISAMPPRRSHRDSRERVGSVLIFSAELRELVGVAGDRVRQHLQRDIAIELRSARTEYLAHPAYADAGDDFADAEARAGNESQTAGSIAVSVAGPRLILCDADLASDPRGAG